MSEEFTTEQVQLLFEYSQNYANFQEQVKKHKFLERASNLINNIIAYCDMNARNKDRLNKYLDNRILAKAAVRQGNWIKNIIKYKFETEPAQKNSVYNALNFLLHPQNELTILSENHRKMFAENALESDYDPITFVEDGSLPQNFTILDLSLRIQSKKWVLAFWMKHHIIPDYPPICPIVCKKYHFFKKFKKYNKYFILFKKK